MDHLCNPSPPVKKKFNKKRKKKNEADCACIQTNVSSPVPQHFDSLQTFATYIKL